MACGVYASSTCGTTDGPTCWPRTGAGHRSEQNAHGFFAVPIRIDVGGVMKSMPLQRRAGAPVGIGRVEGLAQPLPLAKFPGQFPRRDSRIANGRFFNGERLNIAAGRQPGHAFQRPAPGRRSTQGQPDSESQGCLLLSGANAVAIPHVARAVDQNLSQRGQQRDPDQRAHTVSVRGIAVPAACRPKAARRSRK